MSNIVKNHHKGVFKRFLSILLAVSIVITGLNLESIISNAATGTTNIYLVDNTAEKWLDNDNAVLELVDNSNGHDHYVMTKISESMWQATVPSSATNITFNRLSHDGNTQWNSFSAGGRGTNNAYYADGAEYGHWEVIEEEENYFHAGDIVYLDFSEFVSWEKDNAQLYVNFSGASKTENGENDIDINNADLNLYQPKKVDVKIDDYIYQYIVTEEDAGKNVIRFWRGNSSKLWNCSAKLTYEDYSKGKNCVKIEGWNENSQNTYYELDFGDVLFTQESDNSIQIEAKDLYIYGDVITNGTFSAVWTNSDIKGTIKENQSNFMLDYHTSIEDNYFSGEVDYVDYDYTSIDNNSIHTSKFVSGRYENNGNVDVADSALMAIDDISVVGESFVATNAVVYSQLGNIYISASEIEVNGFIYAPHGTVYIEAENVSIQGFVVAQNIKIIGTNNVRLCENEEFMTTLSVDNSTTLDVVEDEDIIDIGEAYFKNIEADSIIYAGEGIYCIKNQLLVTAYEDVTFNQIKTLMSGYNAEIVGYIELTNDYQIEFKDDITDIDAAKKDLESNPLIENVSLNIVTDENEEFYTNDSQWNTEWNEENPGGKNWGIEEIKLESALISLGVISNSESSNSDVNTSMLYNIKVGLMDSGFDTQHEDLNYTKVWNNFEDRDRLINSGSHGTHVSGTMAAQFNNNVGITGICIKNRLYGFSVDGNTDKIANGKGSLFRDKYALALLIGNNVKVINHSLGNGDMAFFAAQGNENALNYRENVSKEYDEFLCKLIRMGYDFIIITSAGNSNNDRYYVNNNENEAPYGYINIDLYNEEKHPSADITVTYGASTSRADVILNDTDARYDDVFQYSINYKVKSRVVSVGALSPDGNMSDFSCRGDRVDILAPGERIYSCAIMGTAVGDPTNYYNNSGTSMAAPHVTGTLGLAFSTNTSVSATKLKSILVSGATDYGIKIGEKNYKVVNAEATVSKTRDVLRALTTVNRNSSTNAYKGIAIGTVVDEDGKPIEGVKVTAVLTSADGLSNENSTSNIVTTDDNGNYEIILLAGSYRLEFEKENYLGETVYYKSIQEVATYIDTVTLYDEGLYSQIFIAVQGKVADAMDGTYVEGAVVRFREGWKNWNSEYISTVYGVEKATTDDNGEYSAILPVGACTAEISKDGYITAYANIVVSPNGGVQYSTITPIIDDNEYRIILTWGDIPNDLDSHIIGTANGTDYHVYYNNKTYLHDGKEVASLDWDDTKSYGPETITYKWNSDCGDCLYYVYDYTNRGNDESMELSYSSAKVTIYTGNHLVGIYNVPVGIKGTRWNVFSIVDGRIMPINSIE